MKKIAHVMTIIGMVATAIATESDYRFSDMNVEGEIQGENIIFTLKCNIDVSRRNVTVPIITSEKAAFIDGTIPHRSRLEWSENTYSLSFTRAYSGTISFKFACRAEKSGDWRVAKFYLPMATITKISILCDRQDFEVQLPGALNIKREKLQDGRLRVSASLTATNQLAIVWKPEIRRLEGELAVACEANTIAVATVGALRLDTVLNYRIIQGKLSKITLKLPPKLNITQITGHNIQSWNIDRTDSNTPKLVINLTTPQISIYTLRIESELAIPQLPCSIEIPGIIPENVLRTSGFLMVGTDSAIKLQVEKQAGLTQIDPAGFPAVATPSVDVRDKSIVTARMKPARSVYCYQYANLPYTLFMKAEDIITTFVVDDDISVLLSDNELTYNATFTVDIKDAPAREILLITEASTEWVITSISGRHVSEVDVDIRDEKDQRLIYVPFKEAVQGSVQISLQMEKTIKPGTTVLTIPAIRVSGAKSEQGTIIIGAEKGVRLIPEKIVNLREAYTGTKKLRDAATQHTFRFKEPAWSATFTIERTNPSIYAEVFHLFSIGEGIMYCSSAITYHIENSPVHQLKVRVPKNAELLEFTGKDIETWTKQDDVCTIRFQTRLIGDYTLLVTYNIPFSYKGASITVGNTETVGIESEVGYIVIASPISLDVKEEQPLSASVIKIGEEEIPADYLLTVKHPVLKAFKYTRNPHTVALKLTPFETERPMGQCVDYGKLETKIMKEGDSITTATFFLKNVSRQHLVVKLPPHSNLWSIKQIDESNNKKDIPAQISNDKLLIPVTRHPDPNTPIIIEVTFAQHHKKLNFWRSGIKGLNFSGLTVPETHISFVRWKMSVPEGFAIAYAKGNMSSDKEDYKTGFADAVKLSINLATAILNGERFNTVIGILRNEIQTGTTGEYTATVRLAGTDAPRLNVHVVPSWIGAGNLPLLTVLSFVIGVILLLREVFAKKHAVLLSASITLLLFAIAQLSAGRCILAVLLLAVIAISMVVILWKIFKAGLNQIKWVLHQIRRKKSKIESFPAEPIPPPPFEPVMKTEEIKPGNAVPPTSAITCIALILWAGMNLFSAANDGTSLPEPEVKSIAVSIQAPKSSREVERSAKVSAALVFKVQEPVEFNILPPVCAITSFEPGSRYLEITKELNGYYLNVKRAGKYETKIDYVVPISEKDGKWKIEIAVPESLSTSSSIIIPEGEMEIKAEGCSFFKSEYRGTNTIAEALFPPKVPIVFCWNPRQRETEREVAVFFCEANALITLRPGVIDLLTRIKYQIPQGELKELRIKVPAGMSVISVQGVHLATWSFEPKEGFLDIILEKPVSSEYDLQIACQKSCEGFPYTASIGMLSISGAAHQRGAIAVTCHENIQVKILQNKDVVPINIEDFPITLFYDARRENPPNITTIRKSFRYDKAENVLLDIHAEPTPPEIKVEENASVTIADFRTVLCTSLKLLVAKSGIFLTHILLPAKFDIETLTGPDVSHWIELKTSATNEEREVVVYFKREITSNTLLNLTLAKMERGVEEKIAVPRVRIKDVKKHTGKLTVSSEKGIKLNLESYTGVDIIKVSEKTTGRYDSELRRAASLTFDIVRPGWEITLKTQVLPPVIKPEVLHHIDITEGMLQCRAFIRYKIENAGVKTFQLLAPSPGLTLTITGQDIARVHEIDKEKGIWQIDLHNKHEDIYSINVTWQETYPYDVSTSRVVKIKSIRTINTEAPHGYIAVTCSGHVEVRVQGETKGLNLEDARNIPPELQNTSLTSAVLCYRILKPDYELNAIIMRHESATVLPAEVQTIQLTTVISDDNKALTHIVLTMNNRNMRFLKLSLPESSDSIWTASVNGKETPVSRDGKLYCIPLEPKDNASSTIEILYSGNVSQSKVVKAPVFQNLPLNNIKWNLYLPPSWWLKRKDSNLELVDYKTISLVFDETQYLERNRLERMARITSARERLAEATRMLKKGKQINARRAFEEAYIYSQGVADLNEDSRIQLHNLSQQQITVGLYNRRNALRASQQYVQPTPESQQEPVPQTALRQQQSVEYSQEYALAIEQKLSPSEKEILQEVANKIIEQQAAAGKVVPAIKTTIPEHGRFISLKRGALIDPMEELKICFTRRGIFSGQLFMLLCHALLVFAGLLCYISYHLKRVNQSDKTN